jgi:CheY-like chemotaxis protein
MIIAKQTPNPASSIALIVEDHPEVSRVVVRVLKGHFKEIFATSDPYEVPGLLEKHRVTHVVSDCNLGDDLPLTIDLIPDWRRACPSIVKIVLFSGTSLGNRPVPSEVDEVINKSAGPEALLMALDILY